jgi:hypothetical protein
MPDNNNITQEFLQKLAPCIERGDLDACVEEAAREMKYHEPQIMAPRVTPLEGVSTSTVTPVDVAHTYGSPPYVDIAARYALRGIGVRRVENPQGFGIDERRFVVPVFSSFLFLIATNQQNNHFFAPFAYFAVKNSANSSDKSQELPPNILDHILKVRVNLP